MDTSHHFSIVCGVDLSDYTVPVLTHLFDEARGHAGADCHIICVVPEPRRSSGHDQAADAVDTAMVAARRSLVPVVGQCFDDLGVLPEQQARTWLHVRSGVAEEQIVELAAEAGADLIVVGRFGVSEARSQRKLRRRVGSVADRVLEIAECPVLVVQGASYAGGADVHKQCHDCVVIRSATQGEQWFCARHHGDELLHAAAIVVGESLGI